MLDLNNPDCLWTGEMGFNELLQSISEFAPVLYSYQAQLFDNLYSMRFNHARILSD